MPRYSDLRSLIPSEQSEAQNSNSDRRTEFSAFRDVKYAEAYLRKLESLTTNEIVPRARAKVLAENPGADEDTIRQLTLERAKEAVAERDARREALRKSLEDAKAQGAGARARDEVQMTEDVRTGTEASPILEEQSWPMKALSVLGAPARAVDGYIAGALKPFQEATKDVPWAVPTKGSMDSIHYPLKEKAAEFASNVATQRDNIANDQRYGMSSPTAGYSQMGAALATNIANLFTAVAPEDVIIDTRDKYEKLEQPSDARYHGVPLSSVPGVIWDNPKILLDSVASGLSEGKEAALDLTPKSAEHETSQMIRDNRQARQKHAIELASREMPNESNQAVAKRAREIYDYWNTQDIGWTESPDLSQFATEAVLDPLNFVPVGAAIKGAAKLAGKTKAGKAVVEATQKVTAPFRWASEQTDALELAGHSDQAALTRAARQIGDAASESSLIADMYKGPFARLSKYGEKTPEAEAIGKAIEKGTPLEEIPEALRDGVEAGRELARMDQIVRKKFDIGKNFDSEGKLLSVDEASLENYLPRADKNPGAIPEHAQMGDEFVGRSSPLARSEQHRNVVAREGTDYTYDAVANWRKHLEERQAKLGATVEIKQLLDYGREYGFVHTVDNADLSTATSKVADAEKLVADAQGLVASQLPGSEELLKKTLLRAKEANEELGKAKIAQQAVEAKRVELEKTTGLQHTELTGKIKKLAERLGQSPGYLAGSKAIILPTTHAKRIMALAPVFDAAGVDATKGMLRAAKSIGELFSDVIKPINQIWRTTHTVVRPAFSPANFMSAPGMTAFALGMRAANPQVQANALKGALYAAGVGSKAARAAKMTLKSGEVRTLGELLDLAQKTGVVDTIDSLMGFSRAEGAAKNAVVKALRAGANATHKAVSFDLPGLRNFAKASPNNIARFGDNYQHLAVFLGALEDTSNLGIAKALDFTAKFAGNYRRLSPIEKSFIKEVVPFYSWLRFISPMLIRQTIENPQRVSKLVSMHQAITRANSQNAPYSENAVSGMLRTTGMPGFDYMQPPAFKEWERTGKIGTELDHRSAMMIMDTPLTLGLGIAAALKTIGVRLTGGMPVDPAEGDPRQMLSPLFSMVLDIAAPPKGPDKPVDASENLLHNFIDAPIGPWKDLINLYGDSPEGDLLRLKYSVGRNFMGLDNLVAGLLGSEGRSLGGLVPGIKAYPNDPERNVAQNSKRAAGLILPVANERLR